MYDFEDVTSPIAHEAMRVADLRPPAGRGRLVVERAPLSAYEAALRRRTLPDADRRARLSAEHEAAHAIVGDALNMGIGRVGIESDGSGYTEVVRSADKRDNAAVVAASGVWIGMRGEYYPEGDAAGCRGDMARLRALCDEFTQREACRRAYGLLRRSRGRVLRLADELLAVGSVDYGQWRREL